MSRKTIQHVMIKGSKQGLTIVIDDSSSFTEILRELEDKLSIHKSTLEPASSLHVTIHTGNRYVTEEQMATIKGIIEKKGYMRVTNVDSNVILLEESKKMAEEKAVTKMAKVVRSGQIIEVKGDLLLIGDVNPGGTIRAGGNIFVLGTLRGRAQAGIHGNLDCVITASVFKPTLVSIGDMLCNSLDFDDEQDTHAMECAFIDQSGEISIDRLQVLSKIRPNISLFEGSV